MNTLRRCDIFDVKFYFYTENHRNNYNIFGGVFSLIFLSFCILTFFTYSIQDFERKSDIYYIKYKNVKMEEEKFGYHGEL